VTKPGLPVRSEAASGGTVAASEYDKGSVGVSYALVKLFRSAYFIREFLKSQLFLGQAAFDKGALIAGQICFQNLAVSIDVGLMNKSQHGL
jgi:hypothetical protein